MKKILSLALLLLSLTTVVVAQECELCGTWTVTRRVFINEDNTTCKIFIRITQHGERYSVKVKELYTYDDGSTKNTYWHECNSISVSGNTISWESLSHVLGNDDYDDNDRINGQRIYSAKCYYVCSATVHDEVLHLRYTVRADLYGRNGTLIGQQWNESVNGGTHYWEHDMYKDDPDW